MLSPLLSWTASAAPTATAWWDSVWFGNLMVGAGLLIAFVGVVAAIIGVRAVYHIYRRQQRDAINVQRQSTLDHLNGVKAGLELWASPYFNTSYAGEAARNRSETRFQRHHECRVLPELQGLNGACRKPAAATWRCVVHPS